MFFKMEILHKELTDKIIDAFFEVYSELGYGYLERVYQNSLFLELTNRGYQVEAQKEIRIFYKNREVGIYYADLVVEDLVILELKAADMISEAHDAQLINYLRGTDKEIGYVLNFGPKPAFSRKIYTNERKIIKKQP